MKKYLVQILASAFLSLFWVSQPAFAQARLAIPTYVMPGSEKWDLWQRTGPHAVGIMIVNLNNGDDTAMNATAAEAVKSARQAGILVLGYVHTGYGKRDPEEVRTKIDAAFKNYETDGIFFDETPTDCGAANKFAGTNLRYYEGLADYVHQRGTGRRLTVLNPGVTPPDDCWMRFSDILVTFEEATLANYQQKYLDQAWTHKYSPERFWHLVYSVSSASDMRAVAKLAQQRGAGWLYVTDDGKDGNPWDDVPPYLAEEAAVWTGRAVQPADDKEPVRRESIRWRASKGTRSQILMDIDQKASTGYHGADISIGADLVIEVPGDGSVNVMRYSGTGTDWKWTSFNAHAKLITPEPEVNIVQFDAAPLGSAKVVKVQFRTLDSSWNPVFTSGVVKWNVGDGR
jgi:hypothetical protein